MVPLAAFAHFAEGSAPSSINHQNTSLATTISFNLANGRSLSDAQRSIEEDVADIGMPTSVHGSFQGTARTFQESVRDEPVLIAAALLAIYIVLGMLYESYAHPLTVLSTLPSAGIGAVLALLLFNMEFSIIALIGVVLLIGIVKKNAILIIDFALDAERARGLSAHDAIREAALLRFRPILMTTLAAALGALPLAIGFGEGAELRRPLGIAIVGGLDREPAADAVHDARRVPVSRPVAPAAAGRALPESRRERAGARAHMREPDVRAIRKHGAAPSSHSGCTLAPSGLNYKRPDAETPEQYKEARPSLRLTRSATRSAVAIATSNGGRSSTTRRSTTSNAGRGLQPESRRIGGGIPPGARGDPRAARRASSRDRHSMPAPRSRAAPAAARSRHHRRHRSALSSPRAPAKPTRRVPARAGRSISGDACADRLRTRTRSPMPAPAISRSRSSRSRHNWPPHICNSARQTPSAPARRHGDAHTRAPADRAESLQRRSRRKDGRSAGADATRERAGPVRRARFCSARSSSTPSPRWSASPRAASRCRRSETWQTAVPEVPAGVPSTLLQRRPGYRRGRAPRRRRQCKHRRGGSGVLPVAHADRRIRFLATSVGELFKSASATHSVGASASQIAVQRRRDSRPRFRARAAYDQSVAEYRQSVLTAFQDVEDQLAASACSRANTSFAARLRGRRRNRAPHPEPVSRRHGELHERDRGADCRALRARALATMALSRQTAAVSAGRLRLGGGWD